MDLPRRLSGRVRPQSSDNWVWKPLTVLLMGLIAAHPAAAQASRTQTSDSPALAEFTRRLIPVSEQLALASVARLCGLRSEDWYVSLQTSYTMSAIDLASRLKVGRDDLNRARVREDQAVRRVLATNPIGPTACARMRNSPTMDKLDALQRRATGNYH